MGLLIFLIIVLIVTIGIIIYMSVPRTYSPQETNTGNAAAPTVPACPVCADKGCDVCIPKRHKKRKNRGCNVCEQDPCQCADNDGDSQPADYNGGCSTGRC